MMGQIIEIIYGNEMSSAKLGEGGVIYILEVVPVGKNIIHYDITLANGTIESIYDIKRVTRIK